MGPGMMTRKFKLALIIMLLSSTAFTAAAQSNWVIATQKFTFTRNQTGSVADGIATMFPARILEKLSSGMTRSIDEEESAARDLYRLRQDKNSLFLQLSSEVKKRDSLFLQKYSQSELNRKLADADKKIAEIKKKLSDNLEEQRLISFKAYENNTIKAGLESQTKESSGKESPLLEKINLYKNDITALFLPSQTAQDFGIEDPLFEKEVVSANINCLIRGQITAYDEYLSLTVQAFVFPGAKEIASITEIGSIDDADLIASNIASNLSPYITNSQPCRITIAVLPKEASSLVNTYIDDILYKNTSSEITIDSGVHFIQFTAQGYVNTGTNYYFSGGREYHIEVTLEKTEEKTLFLAPLKEISGSFVVNGKAAEELADKKARIVINGNAVLGEFLTEENLSSFFYIPQNRLYDQALYRVKVNPLEHGDYIEKARRRMYLSYSILVTSLIPSIICKGSVQSYKSILADTQKQKNVENLEKNIKTANAWVLASNISTGISIACGVWFIFELYRYFKAADSVLPANTKINFDYVPPQEAEREEIREVDE